MMSSIEEELLKEYAIRDAESVFYSDFFGYVKESMNSELNVHRLERKKASLLRHNPHLPEDAIENLAKNAVYEKAYFEALEDEVGSIRNKHTASIVGSMLVNHIRNHPFRFYYDLPELPLPKPEAIVLLAAAETDRYIEQLYKKNLKEIKDRSDAAGGLHPEDISKILPLSK